MTHPWDERHRSHPGYKAIARRCVDCPTADRGIVYPTGTLPTLALEHELPIGEPLFPTAQSEALRTMLGTAAYNCESCGAPMERPYLLDRKEREICASCAEKVTNGFAYQAAALTGGGDPS